MSDSGPEISLEVFSKVVEAIYDCALDPNRWHEVVVMIAQLSQSQRCVLGVHDFAHDRNELMFQLGYEDEDYWRLHEDKYKGMNPTFAPLQLLPVGTVATRVCSSMTMNSSIAGLTRNGVGRRAYTMPSPLKCCRRANAWV